MLFIQFDQAGIFLETKSQSRKCVPVLVIAVLLLHDPDDLRVDLLQGVELLRVGRLNAHNLDVVVRPRQLQVCRSDLEGIRLPAACPTAELREQSRNSWGVRLSEQH